jgi:hypothetical protein
MEWGVVYYAKVQGEIPAEAFLDACPKKIDATFNAVLEAVRAAPPPAFSASTRRTSATSARITSRVSRVRSHERREQTLGVQFGVRFQDHLRRTDQCSVAARSVTPLAAPRGRAWRVLGDARLT